MKRVSLAFAEQETVVKCLGCHTILFQLKCIDEYISYEQQISLQPQKKQINEQFFVLHSNCFPNGSLQIDNKAAKSSSNIIGLSFLKNLLCTKCSHLIGYQVFSVSSINSFLLDRHIISLSQIFIGDGPQNCIEKLKAIIKQDSLNQKVEKKQQQQKLDSNTKKKQKPNQQVRQYSAKNNKQMHMQNQNQSKEKIIKRKLLSQLQQHNEKLLYDAQISNEMIKQIIDTMEFFGDVLEKLDQRVSDVETVANVIKRKVQKVIPLIRKKQGSYQ